MPKVISLTQASRLSKTFHETNNKVIFTTGCFDILHIGHLLFLEKAKKWGGPDSVLMVGVDTDDYVKRAKRIQQPIFPQKVRAKMLAGMHFVDYVVLLAGAKLTPEGYLNRYRKVSPDCLVYGFLDSQIKKKIIKDAKTCNIPIKFIDHLVKLDSTNRITQAIYDRINRI